VLSPSRTKGRLTPTTAEKSRRISLPRLQQDGGNQQQAVEDIKDDQNI